MKTGAGIYIHIPFCKKKCLYCDFFSGNIRITDWSTYISALINEAKIRATELKNKPKTLYIGGGTPSLMPISHFETLIKELSDIFDFTQIEEFTIEANPEDIEQIKCKIWKDMGVNRISLGIQSFNEKELELIGRDLKISTIEKSIETIQSQFDNLSLDLIFGLPSQTLESWTNTLEKTFEMHPHHVSAYSLMAEEGTALTWLVKQKKLNLPSEEEWVQMWQKLGKEIKNHGFKRYEVSNFSLPGFESKHNSSYWDGSPYLGLGPSAHSFDGKTTRKFNPHDIKGYISHYSSIDSGNLSNLTPFYKQENITPEIAREEIIMTSLRTTKGLNLNKFKDIFGKDEMMGLIERSQKFLDAGEVIISNDFLRIKEDSLLILDSILCELI